MKEAAKDFSLNTALTDAGNSATREELLYALHMISVQSHLIAESVLSADDERLLSEINDASRKYFCDGHLFGRQK